MQAELTIQTWHIVVAVVAVAAWFAWGVWLDNRADEQEHDKALQVETERHVSEEYRRAA